MCIFPSSTNALCRYFWLYCTKINILTGIVIFHSPVPNSEGKKAFLLYKYTTRTPQFMFNCVIL